MVVADHTLAKLGSEALGLAADIAVAVFFLLSGLVLTRAWDGRFGRFLVRRFVRLWPVFAVCLTAAGLLAGRVPAWAEFVWIPYPRYDADTLCPPMWSLFIEAWAALAMPLIAWSGRGGAARTLACMAGCIAAAVLWHPADLAVRAFMSYAVCFVAGAGLSRTNFHSPLLESRVPQWLGRISYSLYLSHWLVLHGLTQAFGTVGAAVGAALCFPVGWCLWFCLEQPSIRASRAV